MPPTDAACCHGYETKMCQSDLNFFEEFNVGYNSSTIKSGSKNEHLPFYSKENAFLFPHAVVAYLFLFWNSIQRHFTQNYFKFTHKYTAHRKNQINC